MIFQKNDKFVCNDGTLLKIIELTEKGIRFRVNGSRIVLLYENWKEINSFLKTDLKKLTEYQYKELLDEYWKFIENNSDVHIERYE